MTLRSFGSRATQLALLVLTIALAASQPAAAESYAGRSNMQQAAEANTQLALTYMQRGDLNSAREKIDKALDQDSRSADVQLGAGFLYDRLGEDRKAQSHYELAVKYGDRNPDMLNNLAVFLCRKGDRARGEKLFVEAAGNALYRTPEAAFTNAGRCARADGRPAEADAYFRKALAVRRDFPDALWQLADLNLEQGNGLLARGFLQRYVETSPESASTHWLGYRIETAIGDQEQASLHAERLKSAYATSDQTRELLTLEQARP